jgi:hypothetical protein
MSTIAVVGLVSEYLAFFILHDVFASRHLNIQMLRNDHTVPTRCRHRGGIVDPLGCEACRALRQPISLSNQILDHSIQNHQKPVSFLSSGVSLGSSLTPLNPTITHTQSPHLASIVVKPPKLLLKYDSAVRWVSRLTLPSILGGCDNTPGMLSCVRYKDFLTQVL